VLAAKTRIRQTLLFQACEIFFIDVAAMRLLVRAMRTAGLRPFVPLQTEPTQILHQRDGVFLVTAHRVGIFEPQQEHAGMTMREQAVEQRGAHVA
jgi:hypothetical protein